MTDPPYGLDFMGQSWDTEESGAFDPATWREIARVAKPGAWVLAFGARSTVHRLTCAIEDAGLVITDQMQWWYTGGGVPSKTTRLKPMYEPIVVAQVKPKGSLAKTVERYGTGYLEIEENRIPYADEADLAATKAKNPGREETFTSGVYGVGRPQQRVNESGRHPSNIILDSDVAELWGRDSRYFMVVPKASTKERDAGLSLEKGIAHNPNTCVKPIAVMRTLVRLVTPPGGLVLDPYMGSGSTGCAAVMEDRGFIGMDREDIYVQTSELRIAHWRTERDGQLFTSAMAPAMPAAK